MKFLKVEEIDKDSIRIGDTVVGVGDEVEVCGKKDWGGVVTVRGYVDYWELEDAPAWDSHACLTVINTYCPRDSYRIGLYEIYSLRKTGREL